MFLDDSCNQCKLQTKKATQGTNNKFAQIHAAPRQHAKLSRPKQST
jgi:hypothetical protein